MKLFYTVLFVLVVPLIWLRLIWLGLYSPAYFERWQERFGYGLILSYDKPIIWIHAVSVGEVEASRPVVKLLKDNFSEYQLLITTMTPTGGERVKAIFANTVNHRYLPYDLPFAIKIFLTATHPNFGIIMETEIWPNLISICAKYQIKLILANARMSECSSKGYQLISTLTSKILQSLTFIATQDEMDTERFTKLGADIKKIHTIGNLKYEIMMPTNLTQQGKSMRAQWDINRPVLITASTHKGEEEVILNAFHQILTQYPNLLLIIVPRHPERCDHVTTISQQAGFTILRHSESQPCTSDIQILVVDTMGDLPLFYCASDIAFVGGSLVPHGGHNILEPAALGIAVIIGPHNFNFDQITQQFLQAKAAIQVSDATSLAMTVIYLLQTPHKRTTMGKVSLQLIVNNQGAGMRLIDLIRSNVLKD